MNIYYAPMEGITDAFFRRAHNACFPSVDAYYTPFVSPTQNLTLNSRDRHNVQMDLNQGTPCVPQVLTRNPDLFLWFAEQMRLMGYTEINLNMGCPSGTVTAKGKGAGMLKDTDALNDFLKNVMPLSPLPVSVKTRIGFDSSDEWDRILGILSEYDFCRVIIHPRTCKERYDVGTLHPDCWLKAMSRFSCPLVYNGDIFEKEDIAIRCPGASGVMLGRGLLSNPALAREINGGDRIRKEELIRFYETLLAEWSRVYQPDIVFMKLRVVMKHLVCCFEDFEKPRKKIQKSRNLTELKDECALLFQSRAVSSRPMFAEE